MSSEQKINYMHLSFQQFVALNNSDSAQTHLMSTPDTFPQVKSVLATSKSPCCVSLLLLRLKMETNESICALYYIIIECVMAQALWTELNLIKLN